MSSHTNSSKFSKPLRRFIPALLGESLRQENCVLLGYYAASSGNSLTDVSGQPMGSNLQGSLKKGIITTRCVTTQKNADLISFRSDRIKSHKVNKYFPNSVSLHG